MKRILICLFRSLGDVCMGTTVLRAVRQKFPDATIDFMTEKANVNTLEGNPDVNNIIVGGSYYEALDLFVSGGYDKIYKLNMINHVETAWHHIPELQNQHLVEWYGKKAEVDVSNDKNIYIYPSEEDEALVDSIFKDLNSDRVIVMHTSSGQYGDKDKKYRIESKDWPIMYFEAVAERLIRKKFCVVQIGALSDKKISEDCGIVDLTGKLSFKQTASLLKKCKGFIGVDSGPAYLAGWSGIPTLLIMGATQNQTEKCGPSVGPRTSNVHYLNPVRPNNLSCKPTPCYINCVIGKQGGCIANITTDQVWKALEEIKILEEA